MLDLTTNLICLITIINWAAPVQPHLSNKPCNQTRLTNRQYSNNEFHNLRGMMKENEKNKKKMKMKAIMNEDDDDNHDDHDDDYHWVFLIGF